MVLSKCKLGLIVALILSLGSFAQSFRDVDILLNKAGASLQLSVLHYKGTELVGEYGLTSSVNEIPKGWSAKLGVKKLSEDAYDLKFVCRLEEGSSPSTAVSVSLNVDKWSRDNYLLVPGIVYNGNRYPAIGNGYNPAYPREMYYNPNQPLTISNNPRLAYKKNKASEIELQTVNTSTPSFCYYSPLLRKGLILLTEQGSKFGNHGLAITENELQNNSRLSIIAPSVRKMAAGFGDFHASGDKAPDWKAGDEVTIHARVYVFEANGIPDLLNKFIQVRKEITGPNQPRNILPKSKESELASRICSNNFAEVPAGSYYLPENNKDFQLGWVSGMMNSYPMLALNDEIERKRVSAELDFVVGKLQGRSGFFYGGITAEGKIRPEKMHPDFPAVQAMVRKNSDVLLWLMKHLLLFRAQGHEALIHKSWEDAALKLAAAFERTWNRYGEFGQYIVPETGEIAVFNSTASAIAPAGLAIAGHYFSRPEWTKVARDAAAYYFERDVVKQGLTGGDCGDISMDANSESCFGLLESLMALYHFTGEAEWLRKAEVQAALAATWTISYDPRFPPNSQIAMLGSNMAGAVWASIQNKHAAPGICTSSGDYLFKLYRATGNRIYAELIKDIQHAHAEAVNIPPDHITTNNLVGSSMERIQPSDAEGKGAMGNFINTRNSWTETNGMLMAVELPGIYLQFDKQELVVFDHLEVKITSKGSRNTELLIHNPTRHDARTTVFAETGARAKKPLSYTAFLSWPSVEVRSGESIRVMIDREGKVKKVVQQK